MFWPLLLILGLSASAASEPITYNVKESPVVEPQPLTSSNDSLEGKDANFTILGVCDIDGVLQLTNPTDCKKSVAFGRYKNSVNLTGWAHLEIETFKEYSPELQAYSAGVLEGTLSRKLIGYYIHNMIDDVCSGPNASSYCSGLDDYLKANTAYIQRHINENSTYWQSVRRTYYQFAVFGYQFNNFFCTLAERRRLVLHPRCCHLVLDLTQQATGGLGPRQCMIQLGGDLLSLADKYTTDPDADYVNMNLRCSALIKLTKDDLLAAHVAFTELQSMLRVLKLYKFGIDVPGHTQSFSSYPGVLVSIDDFYTLSSGLVVTETTNGIYNKEINNNIQPELQILYWIRVIAANQLASSGSEWVQIFAQYNSGTYNNQWMVVDYNNYNPAKKFPDYGVFYILEQIPGFIRTADLTSVLKEKGYWASYNIPYFPDIGKFSGTTAKGEEFYFFNYHTAPRAQIFTRDHNKVVDLDTLRQLMRYNDYTHDPLSRCNCTPPYTAEAAIAARGDLNPANGTYPVPQMGHRNHAALDYKGTSYRLAKHLKFNAISSPPYDNVPAFRWSTSAFKDVKHVGLPDLWQFEEVTTKWHTKIRPGL